MDSFVFFLGKWRVWELGEDSQEKAELGSYVVLMIVVITMI